MSRLPSPAKLARPRSCGSQPTMPHRVGRHYLPEQYRHHAWFAAYAPFEAPRIAVVVMIEHAGKGGGQFAGYAKTLIAAYLRQSYPVAAIPLKTTNLTR